MYLNLVNSNAYVQQGKKNPLQRLPTTLPAIPLSEHMCHRGSDWSHFPQYFNVSLPWVLSGLLNKKFFMHTAPKLSHVLYCLITGLLRAFCTQFLPWDWIRHSVSCMRCICKRQILYDVLSKMTPWSWHCGRRDNGLYTNNSKIWQKILIYVS